MKTLEKTNKSKKVRKELKNKINKYLQMHETYKNSYFWSTISNSAGRRATEKRFQDEYPTFKFKFNGDIYEVEPDLQYSAHNVYYSLTIKVNKIKKDIRVLKKII